MKRYVHVRRCRRRQLLEHFGEQLLKCHGCDVCG
jgi:superfamily II DNA helicase RecQ